MAFPDSTKKAPNVFFEVYDGTGSLSSTTSATVSKTRVVNILPAPPTPPLSPPVANFNVTPDIGDTPLTAVFTDTSTGTIVTWHWDFGDSVTSTLQHPSHTYTTAAVYNVTLTVSNSAGSDSVTKSVSSLSVTCEPYSIAVYPWLEQFPNLSDPDWYKAYNDPSYDGVSFNINLGGYALSWISAEPEKVYVSLVADRMGVVNVSGGAVWDTEADLMLDLWRYSNSFIIDNPDTYARYMAVGGSINGSNNPPPGHTEYKGVASYDAWLRSYIQPKLYGKPIVCELWYSLNEDRTDPLKGYNNYSFFGDMGSDSLPSVSLSQSAGYIRNYHAGIFKVSADMSNLVDDDYIVGVSYIGDANGGEMRIIKDGTVLQSQVDATPVSYVYGNMDTIFGDLAAYIGTGKSNCNYLELTTSNGSIWLDPAWPDATGNTDGLFDTYQVKFAFMVDAYTGYADGTYDPAAELSWTPGMFYTLPNAPLLCAPQTLQPGYIPPPPDYPVSVLRWLQPPTDAIGILARENPVSVIVPFGDQCEVLVRDTFSGTGNMATHVGEIGATWTSTNALGSGNFFSDGGNTLADILLNGDGTITPDTYRQPVMYPSGTENLSDTFTLTIDFASYTTGMGPYTGFLGNLSTGEAYVLNWFAVSSYFEIDVYYLNSAGATEDLTYFSVPSLNDTGFHTLTIVSTPTVKSFYLDGVYQTEFNDSRITSGVAFLYLNDCFNGKFSKFEVNSCAVVPEQVPLPPPPPEPVVESQGSAEFSTGGTASATTNTVDRTVILRAGQILKFGTTELFGTTYSGDTFIRLFDPLMSEVASNDDFGGVGSYIEYTALTDGVYTMKLGCYSANLCSGTAVWEVLNP